MDNTVDAHVRRTRILELESLLSTPGAEQCRDSAFLKTACERVGLDPDALVRRRKTVCGALYRGTESEVS